MKKKLLGVLVVLSMSLYASNVPNIMDDYKLIIELIDDLANKIDLNEETYVCGYILTKREVEIPATPFI